MSAKHMSHLLFVGVLSLCSVITVSAQRVDYSDTWVVDTSTSTTLWGCGITDENYTNYGHEYTVTTTLTSPSGTTVTGSGSNGTCSNYNFQCARADVWMSLLDENGDIEEGDFTIESLHDGYCPNYSMQLGQVGTIIVSRAAIAVTNYILTDFEAGQCVYYLYCPNGNASATCPGSNPVYVNAAQNPCRNYLFDARLRVVILGTGVTTCFPVGIAKLSNFAVPCS